MATTEALKERAIAAIDAIAGDLVAASHSLHAHPELNYEEHHAHQVLTDMLGDARMTPTRSAHGLATAFEATAGSSGATVAVLCEYDALPGIGHGCGHNVIATAGLGAGIALASLAEEAGGRLRLLGTPAEEGGGGKVEMARRGAFDGVDAAMMIHPADAEHAKMSAIAIQQLFVRYVGRAAHAATAPEKGQNALDAAVLGYVNVAALRQHILPTERLHGIFTRAGEKPNIVPAETEMDWYVRSPTIETLQPLKARVAACLEASAAATGCTAHLEWQPNTYADVVDNMPLLAAYCANSRRIGRHLTVEHVDGTGGSTDMGNVSYLVPSIHPMLAVAPAGVSLHTPEFAEHARGADADRAVVEGAKIMALTAIDVWASAELRAEMRREFGDRPTPAGVL
ncbi:MAG: M20 family metallopeptidase [Acidimicrobiia bacterium]